MLKKIDAGAGDSTRSDRMRGERERLPLGRQMKRVVRHERRHERRLPRSLVVAFLAVLLAASVGGASRGSSDQARAPGAFFLTWSAPAECPSREQVAADIARLVAGEPRLQDGSDLRADVTVSRGPSWSAELTTEHAGRIGHRRIEAPSCQTAAEAIELILALSIDPDAVSTTARPATTPAPGAAHAPPGAERQVKFLLGVHAQGRVGTLPGTDVGIGLGIGLAGARWSAELRGTYGLRRDQTAALPSGAAGRFDIVTGSLTGCIDFGRTRLAFGPCAVGEAGRASATGYGATAGFSKNVLWLAIGGGLYSSVALSRRLRASIEVDALAPLYRPDYVFTDMPGVVYAAPPVGARALIDVSWQF